MMIFTDRQKKELMYSLRNDYMFDEPYESDMIYASTYLTSEDLKDFEHITHIKTYDIWFDMEKGLMVIRW